METKIIIEEKLHEYAESYFNANCGKQEIELMAEDIYSAIKEVLPQADVIKSVCDWCKDEFDRKVNLCGSCEDKTVGL